MTWFSYAMNLTFKKNKWHTSIPDIKYERSYSMLTHKWIHFCTHHTQNLGLSDDECSWRDDELKSGGRPWGCLQSLSLVRREQRKGHQPYHALGELRHRQGGLESAFSVIVQQTPWSVGERGSDFAVLWQRVPSAMLCLLRDGSVTAWLDWHSVKGGLLRALKWKDPSQQHFKHLALAKLSADFNNAHLFGMDVTSYYTDIKVFDTEWKYKQTNACRAAACLLTQ